MLDNKVRACAQRPIAHVLGAVCACVRSAPPTATNMPPRPAGITWRQVDLYTAWGKLWSCGGAGQCGTCIVQVQAGGELLSGRTATEDKKLNKARGGARL
jgi:hypothetical protein